MHATRSADKNTRHRLLRRSIRIGAGLITVLIIAYLMLPVLIPRSWLLRRVSDRLTALMNRQTTIGSIELSCSGATLPAICCLSMASSWESSFSPMTTPFTVAT